ncbi:uncharacterized protein V6R79_015417 [Siganus canaliculatus]
MATKLEEETLNDSFPCLKELENKVGRKTPESLLIWMKDAADYEDDSRSDTVDRGDYSSASSESFSDKINNLKQEMRWLRSADVRILRQLVTVHEGIEAMRWLMEERDTLVSRGSSLTGSLSSLATVEEHGPSMSPCRESLSPAKELTESPGEESEEPPPNTGQSDSNHKSCFDMPNPEPSTAKPSSSNSEITYSMTGRQACASHSPASNLVCANLTKSQLQDSSIDPLQDKIGSADTVRRALLRSSWSRQQVKVNSGSTALAKQSEEAQTEKQTQESFTASQGNQTQKEESLPDRNSMLLGYDAQWSWVESQDDVTFL